MFDATAFWIAFVALFCLGATFPIAVFIQLRKQPDDAIRWIKNSPTFTVYMGFAYPASVALFFATVDFSPFLDLSGSDALITYGSFPLFLLIALFPVHETIKRITFDPLQYKNSPKLVEVESAIRKRIRAKRRELRDMQGASDEEKELAYKVIEEERSIAFSKLETLLPDASGFHGLHQHGSAVAWVTHSLNVAAGVFFAVLFWFLFIHVVNHTAFENVWLDPIFVVIGLLVLWFPLRLYAEWYLYFYSLKEIRQYYAFWMILVATCVGYLFVVFQQGENVGTRVFSVTGTCLMAVIGALGKFKPEWVGYVADVVDEMPFRWYAMIMLVILIGLSTMIFGLFKV